MGFAKRATFNAPLRYPLLTAIIGLVLTAAANVPAERVFVGCSQDPGIKVWYSNPYPYEVQDRAALWLPGLVGVWVGYAISIGVRRR